MIGGERTGNSSINMIDLKKERNELDTLWNKRERKKDIKQRAYSAIFYSNNIQRFSKFPK